MNAKRGSAKTVEQLLQEARASLPGRLSAPEAARAQAEGALLVDIRGDDQRRADGSILGALVIARNSLEWRCDPASPWRHPDIHDHDQQLVLICNEGFQSSLAAATLQELGMRHATDVIGGFVAWKGAGLPVTPPDRTREAPRARNRGSQTRQHWEGVYERTGPMRVSWYQAEPGVSLQLIDRLGVTRDSAVLDVGAGASGLASALVHRGFRDVTVVDVSEHALAVCKHSLGAANTRVHLVCDDLLTWKPRRRYDVWHDRALLHFFVDPAMRAGYVDLLRRTVKPGGAVIIGAFAEDGPDHCSGLPVFRYSATGLAALLGEGFELVEQRIERHRTPAGDVQPFQWAAFVAMSL